jgi:sugar (pentulose or hexulose) kinase
VTKEGGAVNSTGTAEVLSTVFEKPLLSVVMRQSFYPCYLYTKPGLFFTFSLNHTGGIIYQWFIDEFCYQEQQKAKTEQKKAYALLDEQFSSVPTGLFFFPHFNGSGTPTCNLLGKGTLLGMTLDTSRIEVAKSILEGLTYELRFNMETMEEAGINIKEIIAVGGGAKSQTWLRLKAAITNRPIKTLRNNDAACLGAAILAAVGSKYFNSIDEATKEWVKFDQVLEPHQATAQLYEGFYQRYRRLYQGVLALYNP